MPKFKKQYLTLTKNTSVGTRHKNNKKSLYVNVKTSLEFKKSLITHVAF